jgi:16S rRNA (guanine966-N2)-methyltransferase
MAKPNKNSPPAAGAHTGQLRLIGGQWRGRKLQFPALPGLRPTPDRIRETLFNWLAAELPGAHCLDLFAGSGALGLEALSRGAADCTFVDSHPAACRQIGAHLRTLGSDRGQVICDNAARWLAEAAPTPFDILFLDPPFGTGLLAEVCGVAEQRGWLSANAFIYMECGSDEQPPPLPPGWQPHRDKRAGQVAYRLYRREAAGLAVAEPIR